MIHTTDAASTELQLRNYELELTKLWKTHKMYTLLSIITFFHNMPSPITRPDLTPAVQFSMSEQQPNRGLTEFLSTPIHQYRRDRRDLAPSEDQTVVQILNLF